MYQFLDKFDAWCETYWYAFDVPICVIGLIFVGYCIFNQIKTGKEFAMRIEDLKVDLAIWGRKVGYSLIALISLWDFFVMGFRGFYEYSISYLGVSGIWIGLLIIVLSFSGGR